MTKHLNINIFHLHELTCLKNMMPKSNIKKGLHQTCCKFGDIDIQQRVRCEGPW